MFVGLFVCFDVDSINFSLLTILYLFLCIDLLKTLDSNANFIDLSFFTVITIGDMKNSSEQLDSFSKCPSFCRRSNSTLNLGWKLIGTRRPF